jgi:hypothetical protein
MPTTIKKETDASSFRVVRRQLGGYYTRDSRGLLTPLISLSIQFILRRSKIVVGMNSAAAKLRKTQHRTTDDTRTGSSWGARRR